MSKYRGFSEKEMECFLGKQEHERYALSPRWVQKKGESIAYPLSVKEFENFFSITYLPWIQFPSLAVFRQVLWQRPWSTVSDRIKQALWQGVWYQKNIFSGQTAPVSVRYIGGALGYGVFAEKKFLKGDFLGCYTGLVHQWSVFQQNQNGFCFHYPSGYFHFRIFMVDALNAGNEMRFVNHSDHPNAEPIATLDRGLYTVVFRASSSIEQGEQITIRYGKDYWMRREKLDC